MSSVNFFKQFIIFSLFNNIVVTTSLSLLKPPGTVANLSTFNLFALLSKLFKPVGTFSSLSLSNLPTSDFKLAKSTFLANFDVLTTVALLKYAFVAYLDKSNSNLKISVLENIHPFILWMPIL